MCPDMGLVWELYDPTHVLLEIIMYPFGLWASAHKPVVLCLLFISFYVFVFLPQVVNYYLEQLGCPFKRLKNEPSKPVIDR